MEDGSEYITKADLREAFREFVPQLVNAIDKRFEPRFRKIKAELDKKPDRADLDKKPDRADLDKKPDRDEVRQIVRDEVEIALSGYRLMKVK
ncbi:MAG: hypothetical protein HQL01_13150 [Nitrospirae bacterium]|nr:hypothetical protein [Nitrospirota bacterium]